MARVMAKTMMFITSTVIIMLINGISAHKLFVGDDNGWILPPSPDFYDLWAAEQNFVVGVTLVFEFTSGAHNVATVRSKEAYEKCDSSLDKNAVIVSEGPYEITPTKAGQYYYFCAVGTHCENGQKFAANFSVTPRGHVDPPPPTPPMSPPSTPSSPPPAPSATPPPTPDVSPPPALEPPPPRPPTPPMSPTSSPNSPPPAPSATPPPPPDVSPPPALEPPAPPPPTPESPSPPNLALSPPLSPNSAPPPISVAPPNPDSAPPPTNRESPPAPETPPFSTTSPPPTPYLSPPFTSPTPPASPAKNSVEALAASTISATLVGLLILALLY